MDISSAETWSILVFLSLALFNTTKGLECKTPSGNCACETDKGLLDLSLLDSLDPNNPKFFDVAAVTGGQDYFSFNPCTGFTEGYSCTGVALCQKRDAGYYTNYFPIGDQKPPLWTNDLMTGELQMQFESNQYGVVRTSLITLICDSSLEGELVPYGEEQQGSSLFTFELKTKYACLGGGMGGLSVGSILLIAFICMLFVYILAGVVFNTVSKGATGKERLPNSEFWGTVPSLIKDGGSFCVSKIKGGSSGKETYESM